MGPHRGSRVFGIVLAVSAGLLAQQPAAESRQAPPDAVDRPIGTWSGYILDESTGAPVPGVEVRLWNGDGYAPPGPFDRVVVATTGSDGRYDLPPLLPPGARDLESTMLWAFRRPGYMSFFGTAHGPPNGAFYKIQPGAVAAAFRVVDADGRAIPDVAIEANFFGATTDAEGRCRLEGLWPGLDAVESEHVSFVSSKHTFDANAEENVLILDRGRSQAGRVHSPNGAPAADAEVFLLSRASRGAAAPKKALAGPDGAFVATGLHDGPFKWWCRHPDGGFATGSAEAPSAAPLEIKLVRGAVFRVRPLDVDGRPAVDATVAPLSFDSERWLRVEPAPRLTRTDDGVYVFSGMKAPSKRATYGVRVIYPDASESIVFVGSESPGGADAVVDVRPPDAGFVVSGVVVDEAGAPVDGASVIGAADVLGAPSPPFETVSDAKGRFKLRGFRTGRNVVTVRRDGFVRATRDVSIPARDGEEEDPRIVLKREHLIVIHAVDPSGAPIEGVAFQVEDVADKKPKQPPLVDDEGFADLSRTTPPDYDFEQMVADASTSSPAPGVYHVAGAPAGAYRIHYVHRRFVDGAATVKSPRADALTISMVPSKTIHLRVVEGAESRPVAYAKAEVLVAGSRYDRPFFAPSLQVGGREADAEGRLEVEVEGESFGVVVRSYEGALGSTITEETAEATRANPAVVVVAPPGTVRCGATLWVNDPGDRAFVLTRSSRSSGAPALRPIVVVSSNPLKETKDLESEAPPGAYVAYFTDMANAVAHAFIDQPRKRSRTLRLDRVTRADVVVVSGETTIVDFQEPASPATLTFVVRHQDDTGKRPSGLPIIKIESADGRPLVALKDPYAQPSRAYDCELHTKVKSIVPSERSSRGAAAGSFRIDAHVSPGPLRVRVFSPGYVAAELEIDAVSGASKTFEIALAPAD